MGQVLSDRRDKHKKWFELRSFTNKRGVWILGWKIENKCRLLCVYRQSTFFSSEIFWGGKSLLTVNQDTTFTEISWHVLHTNSSVSCDLTMELPSLLPTRHWESTRSERTRSEASQATHALVSFISFDILINLTNSDNCPWYANICKMHAAITFYRRLAHHGNAIWRTKQKNFLFWELRSILM